jgi:hypothetical protein
MTWNEKIPLDLSIEKIQIEAIIRKQVNVNYNLHDYAIQENKPFDQQA